MNILYGVSKPVELTPEEYEERIRSTEFEATKTQDDLLEIDCKAKTCIYNKSEKCTVPSLCDIDEEGKCSGFKGKAQHEN